MIYATSDLHGCHPDVLRQLLDKANFSDSDFLFILGDVIDRGEYGAELLLWLTQQQNVQLILGNHEAMMLSCRFLFREVTDESLEALTQENLDLLMTWLANGANPTLNGLKALLKREPELVEGILEYLEEAPLYEFVRVGGNRYWLTHAGLGNYQPGKHPEDYTLEELTMHRPALEAQYAPGIRVIFGHTPTQLYGEEYAGRALHTPSWTNIDTGAAAGGNPMLLRLDDMKEFYL